MSTCVAILSASSSNSSTNVSNVDIVSSVGASAGAALFADRFRFRFVMVDWKNRYYLYCRRLKL